VVKLCSMFAAEMAKSSWFLLLLFFIENVVSKICTFLVSEFDSRNPIGNLTFISHFHPSPPLVTFKFCLQNRVSPMDCQTIMKYYHSYCLNQGQEPDLSELEMFYLISFANPVKIRNPINLNSLIPLHLTKENSLMLFMLFLMLSSSQPLEICRL
jgi:hypothetical protein